MTNTSSEANHARLEIVREHVRRENAHDLAGIMATFGDRARYDDEPWDDHYVGRNAVAGHYADMLAALPDLHIGIEHQFAAEEGVILEVRIRGTHLGPWRGLPPTGRRVEFPLCAVFTLDAKGTLAGERIYYDRGSVLQQIGLYHDPQSTRGRIEMLLAHPLTITRAFSRKLIRRTSG
jgi:steroid delta-isomerase-like uncharacterized protein